jgi:hypothetical protein
LRGFGRCRHPEEPSHLDTGEQATGTGPLEAAHELVGAAHEHHLLDRKRLLLPVTISQLVQLRGGFAVGVKAWLARNGIDTHYIEPGSPWQNAYNESFNSIFRTTCLNRWTFESVAEAKAVSGQWLEEYNTIRLHGSLAGRSPSQFIKDWEDARSTSTQRKRRSLT